MLRNVVRHLTGLFAVALIGSAAPLAVAAPVTQGDRVDRTDPLPKRLHDIDVVERLEAQVPRNLSFVDDQGKRVKLGDFFQGDLPTIMTLNYSNCPMLCSLQLTGLVESLAQLDWTAGKEFRIVTVSLDPEEKPQTARRTKQRYLSQYGRQTGQSGWHFLTGNEANIRAAADAIGFRYGYNEKRQEYVHPAAIALLTPDGRIARYLYGIQYHPKTLRLSLVEVSEGKIGSTVDRLILYCFHYDATEGRYAPVALNVMRLGGAAGAVALGGFLMVLWRSEAKKKKKLNQS